MVKGALGRVDPLGGVASRQGRGHFRKGSPSGKSRFKEAGFFEQEVTFGIRPLERGPFGRGLF